MVAPRPKGDAAMFDDLDRSLLLVAAILLGFALLLFVLARLDATTQRRPVNQTKRSGGETRR